MTEARLESAGPSPATPPTQGVVPLRLVPDPSTPLGTGVLPAEEPFDQDVVCRRVLRVTHDVVTVVLEPTRPGGLAFRPGQFLTLVADVDGERVERCYTISSPPTRPHLLTVTVKRVPGGALSPYLHDRLRPGDRLGIRGPLGDFSVADHPAPSYLLLSAGSGVTPTLSTLRTIADLAEPVDVVVVHHARTPADLACRAEVDAIGASHASMRVVWVCADDADPASGLPRWNGARGRIDAARLLALVPDVAEREVLTCGPPGYMAAARTALAEVGADPARCHEESFVLGSAGAPEVAVGPPPVGWSDASPVEPSGDAPAGTATIRFARSGLDVSCPPGVSVLDAAAAAGIVLPSSCTEGLCGTCTSTLVSGSVDMRHQGGIRPRQIAAKLFLPCCSTPLGDIEVDA